MSKSKIRQNYVAIVKYLLETKNFRWGNINEKVYKDTKKFENYIFICFHVIPLINTYSIQSYEIKNLIYIIQNFS